MNFLTGLLILLVMCSTAAGFSTTEIADFFPDCTLQAPDALHKGDEIYRIDGKRVYLYSDISMLMDRNKTGIYDLEVKRDGEIISIEDLPVVKKAYEQNGETVYRYGLYFASQNKTFGNVMKNAWYSALDFARMVWLGLSDLIKGFVRMDDMSGPVGIVSVIAKTGQTAENTAAAVGRISYLAAFLAVNLAVMNMLPIPALDGGRVFFLLITAVLEKLLRRKIDPKYEGYIHAAGMVLLLLLIAFITLKDIGKLFAG